MTTGVVLGRRGGTYRVYTEAGEVTASLRGKLKFKDDDDKPKTDKKKKRDYALESER